MNEFTKTRTIIAWICRSVAAAILLQTLFFKFTPAPESVYIFSEIGMEPWGRIGSGIAELRVSTLAGMTFASVPWSDLGEGKTSLFSS
jgi:hypothetical protein